MILNTELENKGNLFPSKIISYRKDVDTFYFTTENFVVLQVTVRRDSVLRFRYSTKTIFDNDFSYAIADDANNGYNHLEITDDNDKYIITLPTTSGSFTSSSTVMVYDTFRKAWLEWNNINASGGMVLRDDSLFFQEREFRALSGSTETSLYKIQDTGDTWDYADHTAAIPFRYASHWEALQEPSMFKKFTRCKVHSLGLTQDDFESNAFKLNLFTELDYFNTTRTEAELDFAGTSGGWGNDPWGSFAWGATRLIGLTTKLRPMKCRSLRLVLENNTVHENVLVSGYEFEIATPYKKFIKE
mgnify:CR=1 FL=1